MERYGLAAPFRAGLSTSVPDMVFRAALNRSQGPLGGRPRLPPYRQCTFSDAPLKLAMNRSISDPTADLLLQKTLLLCGSPSAQDGLVSLVFASHSLLMWALKLLEVDASREAGREAAAFLLAIWMPLTLLTHCQVRP